MQRYTRKYLRQSGNVIKGMKIKKQPVAQGQYVVSDTRCPAMYAGE